MIRSSKDEVGTAILSVPEITASIESLYVDELKPFGRVLLKRLRERAAARAAQCAGLPLNAVDPESMPRIDPRRLRRICEACNQLVVEPEDGREFSATIAGRMKSFLDVCSPFDVYPAGLWEQLGSYLGTLEKEEMNLPGGRYACAMELAFRDLPCFAGRSLGQLCHIVQLAVSQKRLLGYSSGGNLVPYRHSEAWVKEQCAAVQAPMSTELMEIASWEDTRLCLQNLLISPKSSSGIAISSVKRLFRSEFNLELSVTALGHTRLLEVLTDPRLADICWLDVQTTGFMVRGVCPLVPPGVWNPESACNSRADFTTSAEFAMLTVAAVPVMCLGWQSWDSNENGSCEVLVSPGASPPSSPRNSAGSAGYWNKYCSSSSSTATDTPCESDLSSLSDETESSVAEFGGQTDDDTREGEGVPWNIRIKGTFIHVSSPGKAHGSKQRSRSFHL